MLIIVQVYFEATVKEPFILYPDKFGTRFTVLTRDVHVCTLGKKSNIQKPTKNLQQQQKTLKFMPC